MNYLDIAIIIILGLGTILSAIRGVYVEILSIIGWGVAYYLAKIWSADLAPIINISDDYSFLVVLTSLGISFKLFIGLLSVILPKKHMPISALIGAIKMACVLSIYASIMSYSSVASSDIWRDSSVIPYISQFKQYLDLDFKEVILNNSPTITQDSSEILDLEKNIDEIENSAVQKNKTLDNY